MNNSTKSTVENMIASADLASTIAELKASIASLNALVESLKSDNEYLKNNNDLLVKRMHILRESCLASRVRRCHMFCRTAFSFDEAEQEWSQSF